MGSVEHVLSAGAIEGDDDKLGQAVTNMALTSLKRLAGRQAVIKTGTSRDAVWLAGAYGVVNTAFVEQGHETFHAIHVEASSSFLALRISLLAAALLAALVWILRLLVKRLIRVLA